MWLTICEEGEDKGGCLLLPSVERLKNCANRFPGSVVDTVVGGGERVSDSSWDCGIRIRFDRNERSEKRIGSR